MSDEETPGGEGGDGAVPPEAASVERPDVPGHRVETVIGAGGSAVVWAGADAAGRRVAIKVPHRVHDEVDAHQALVEQQVLMSVRHDHLVPLRSVVPLDDGRDALVFDLVRGAVLRGMVRARGHLRPGEVVTVLTPICEAVAHLHSAGGLHGDVSPSNIMVTADGRPVLLDLGAARVAGHDPGDVQGTDGFVAPEVRLGFEAGEAADVYALGAVAWFCATGNGAPDTLARLDPETIASHVGPDLAPVVEACIDPDPDRRPNAAAVARLFYDAATPEPVEVVVGADQASALTHRLRAEAGRGTPVVQPGSRRVWPRRLVAAVLVATPVLAAAGWALAARAGDSPAVRTETRSTVAAPAGGRATLPGGAPTTVDRAVIMDPASPSARPEDLLQALSERRAAVLVDRDVPGLDTVHAAGSPSLASDRSLVAQLRRSGVRWSGLRLEVADAVFVWGTAAETVLRARVDWTAYVVVTRDGATTQRPADSGRRLDFALRRGAQGWRIASVSVAPAT